MSAGAGTPAEMSGVREAPGEELARSGGFARFWKRWHLVPFAILMVAVIVATVAGVVTRERLREAAFAPPVGGTTTGESLPGACAAPSPDLPAEQPWQGQARVPSEQAFKLGVDANSMVVPGKDGWVFWNDIQANNFSQALGRRVLSQAELDAWYAAMHRLDETLGAQGIDFVIQVVPAKWSVYPQQLPEWATNLRGSTTLDYLRYAHPDLPILDMREGLRAASAEQHVYTPLNSHWTRWGAAQGWGILAGCLGAVNADRYAGLGPLGIADVTPAAESNEFAPFGFAPTGENDPVPVWSTPPGTMSVTLGSGAVSEQPTDHGIDMLELPAHTVTAAPQSAATAVIFRDSQGNNIGAGWQAGFAQTWQVAHNLDKPDQPVDFAGIALQHKPDVVVLEITERHLNFVPPAGA